MMEDLTLSVKIRRGIDKVDNEKHLVVFNIISKHRFKVRVKKSRDNLSKCFTCRRWIKSGRHRLRRW